MLLRTLLAGCLLVAACSPTNAEQTTWLQDASTAELQALDVAGHSRYSRELLVRATGILRHVETVEDAERVAPDLETLAMRVGPLAVRREELIEPPENATERKQMAKSSMELSGGIRTLQQECERLSDLPGVLPAIVEWVEPIRVYFVAY